MVWVVRIGVGMTSKLIRLHRLRGSFAEYQSLQESLVLAVLGLDLVELLLQLVRCK